MSDHDECDGFLRGPCELKKGHPGSHWSALDGGWRELPPPPNWRATADDLAASLDGLLSVIDRLGEVETPRMVAARASLARYRSAAKERK